MNRMYHDLAAWWPLLSPPAEYADEAAFFLPLLAEITESNSATLLELGSGGGNNALHMKGAFKAVTLVDLSREMLEVSRSLNPDCEHLPGDMRSVRLGRTFDAVFIHDAVDYMTTEADLRAAIGTAFMHCKPGGMALFVPDHVRNSFEPYTESGGTASGGRGIRYLEWAYDPNPDDHTCVTEHLLLMHEAGMPSVIAHERTEYGLFDTETWLTLLEEAGFSAGFVIDGFERHVFIGRRP